ncbi:MAG: efflux RND transporter periplasmic adaptor subunit [Desulfobacteraceae bacterium]|jgi:RND family efflux transporter MFP subunit
MKHDGRFFIWSLGVVTCLMTLVACKDEPPAPKEVIRPVRFEQIFISGGKRTRTFSGVAQAGQQIDLSFKIAGTVQRVAVKMGDTVKAGDMLAQLDPQDTILEMEEAEASLLRQKADARNAAANYQRIEALYESNNTSLSELDAARAQTETAQAAVRSAEKALELAKRKARYTQLLAPVDGAVALKSISENENVQAGQVVLVLSAGTHPEVQLAIPEVLIVQVKEGAPVHVSFDALPGEKFDATVREVGVASTAGGATYPVTVRLDQNNEGIRPGMAAEVNFVFEDQSSRLRFIVPAKAVGEDIHGKYAFIVKPSDNALGIARRVKVTTGALTADGLEIFDGLSDGDYLVTAGVHKLRDGQKVKFSPPDRQ